MKTLPCVLFALLLAVAGCNDPNCSADGCAGSAGSGAGAAGQGGAGGSSTAGAAGTTSSVGGTAGSGGSGAVGGSGGSGGCPAIDDANPCTNDAAGPDQCSPTHTAKPDGEICSVEAQIGSCLKGNCLAGKLGMPTCGVVASTTAATAEWVALFVPFEAGAHKLVGAAAVVPVGAGCALDVRRYRVSVPVIIGSPESLSPEGVPLAKELTVDPAAAWPADGMPWIGSRSDGSVDAPAGSGVWVEVELPAGACAATCSQPEVPTGVTCGTASDTALSNCAPGPRFLLAALGF